MTMFFVAFMSFFSGLGITIWYIGDDAPQWTHQTCIQACAEQHLHGFLDGDKCVCSVHEEDKQ